MVAVLNDGAHRKAAVVVSARGWLGTPYRHQCSVKGQGADCLGLVRGVWRDVLGPEPTVAPAYTADWSEVSGQERLWQGALRHLREVSVPSAGDILLFRMRRNAVAKHLAIIGNDGPDFLTIIHAYSGRGVVETPLTQAWRRRVVASFEFPLEG